ncbi:PREDICTED: uncharacterized protein LOC109469439 [Branchiostoma belcheri]|uniref:Uncharacterized protein LOC109469439 n=1 Tax=Branchiostoma belcheri TaxID=7741 RepID=A0A6P4YXK0_BRABE|nr:PREDICTED: uncharacterized protein LOC109469439 [Branchiostoma belcheri]
MADPDTSSTSSSESDNEEESLAGAGTETDQPPVRDWEDAVRLSEAAAARLGQSGVLFSPPPARTSTPVRQHRRHPPFKRDVMLLDSNSNIEIARPPRGNERQRIVDDGREFKDVMFNREMNARQVLETIRNAIGVHNRPLYLYTPTHRGWRYSVEPLEAIDGERIWNPNNSSTVYIATVSQNHSIPSNPRRQNTERSSNPRGQGIDENPGGTDSTNPRGQGQRMDQQNPGGANSTNPRGQGQRMDQQNAGGANSPNPRGQHENRGLDSARLSVFDISDDEIMDVEEYVPINPARANANDIQVVITTPGIDVGEDGSLYLNENFGELFGGPYDPFTGHLYNTVTFADELGGGTQILNLPILTIEFELAQAQATTDLRVLLVAITPPQPSNAIMRILLEREVAERLLDLAYLWVAGPNSSQGNLARTRLSLPAHSTRNILVVCVPGQTSRMRTLRVFDENNLSMLALFDAMELAETTVLGVRQQRANYQQWRAVRARQDEEFQAVQAVSAEPQAGPSRDSEVEMDEPQSEMDEYADSDMSEEESHSQNAFLHTRAAWQNFGLQQLVTFPQHGRHNSMRDTSAASTVPLIQEDPDE